MAAQPFSRRSAEAVERGFEARRIHGGAEVPVADGSSRRVHGWRRGAAIDLQDELIACIGDIAVITQDGDPCADAGTASPYFIGQV